MTTTSLDAPPGPTPAAQIGPYVLQGQIGEGGMGVVYRAVHRETGKVVALKTVRRVTPHLLEAVRREVHALSGLHHEGVVAITDSGVDQLSPWFAMELLDRRTVDDFYEDLWKLRQRPIDRTTQVAPTSPDDGLPVRRDAPGDADVLKLTAAAGKLGEVLALVSRIAAALAYVHGEGLVHRDLKPQNIFLRANGSPVLVDFGLTAWFGGGGGERLDMAKRRAGTVPFMAPEVIRGEQMDGRADLYALGCLFYLLVTGQLPFESNSDHEVQRMHLDLDPTPPSVLVDGLPQAVEELILALLAKAPEERLGHALDVVDALAPLVPAQAAPADPARAKRFHLYRPRLAGRDDLIAELQAQLDLLMDGRGGLVFVGGESGSGKTFLASDFAARAEQSGVRVLTGECDPLVTAVPAGRRDEHNVPLHPFRKVFRAVVDRCLQGGAEVTQRLVGGREMVLARYHRAFAELANRHLLSIELDGEEARSGAIEAMAAMLAALAAERPTLLVLDDLHWADALSLDVLRFLGPELFARTPLLVVATYRTEEVGAGGDLASLLERPDARPIRLARLDRDAVAKQIRDMLALPTAPPALVSFLDENAEGVPFFVAEYLRAAMEKEILHRRGGRWLVSATGESLDRLSAALDLPRSLHELVAGRLSRVSEAGRAVAVVAAVLGRQFDARVLADTVGRAPEYLLDGLTDLLKRQVLEQPTPGLYRFMHDKVRETVYQEISADERRRHHGRAASVIEARGDDPDAYPALAQHFRISGDGPKAAHYARLAGKQAWMKGAFRDAREHLARALELQPPRDAAQATPAERLTEAQTRHWLASSLFCSGEVDQAIERFGESLTWLGQGPLPRTRGAWGRWIASLLLRQLGHRWLPAATYSIRQSVRRDMAAEAAQIAVRLSWSFAFRYRLPEMLAAVLLGANLSDRSSARGPMAAAHSALGSFLGHMGLHGTATRYFERARRSAADCADPMARVREAQSECVFYLNQGRWDALRSAGEPALAAGMAVGSSHETEALAQALATAALLTGDVAEGERQARVLAETADRLGHHIQSCWGLLTVAAAQFRRGRFAEVSALLAPVEPSSRERKDIVSHLECLALMAAVAQRRGDATAALELAERASEVAAGHGAGSLFGYSFHWLLPEVFAAQALRPSLPRAERAHFVKRFEESRLSAQKFARMCHVARPFSALHRGRGFQLAGQQAKAVAAFRDSHRLAEGLGMPFDRGLASLELGRAEGLEPLERARHAAAGRHALDLIGCAEYEARP